MPEQKVKMEHHKARNPQVFLSNTDMKVFPQMVWSSNIIWVIDIFFKFFNLLLHWAIYWLCLHACTLLSGLSDTICLLFFLTEWTCDLANLTCIISTILEWSLIHSINLNHSCYFLQGMCSKPVIYPAANLVNSLKNILSVQQCWLLLSLPVLSPF